MKEEGLNHVYYPLRPLVNDRCGPAVRYAARGESLYVKDSDHGGCAGQVYPEAMKEMDLRVASARTPAAAMIPQIHAWLARASLFT